jgi:hypothetical protein
MANAINLNTVINAGPLSELSKDKIDELKDIPDRDNKIILITNEIVDGKTITHVVSIKDFIKMFPVFMFAEDNNYYLTTHERTYYFLIDINSNFAKKIISKKSMDAIIQQTFNKVDKHILNEEQRTKFCLILDNKVVHVFDTEKEAIDKINENPKQLFICYTPRKN